VAKAEAADNFIGLQYSKDLRLVIVMFTYLKSLRKKGFRKKVMLPVIRVDNRFSGLSSTLQIPYRCIIFTHKDYIAG
jgi:hypothetical protein